MDLGAQDPYGRRKASSPPPLLFGYPCAGAPDTPPFDPAPAPPGPALLDDTESNMLDNFFTTMNSTHFDNDFWFGTGNRQDKKSDNPSFFEWPEDLPPIFEGSATSLPQPPAHSHSLAKAGTNPSQPEVTPTSEVIAAASMLYQNGMNGNEFGPSYPGPVFGDTKAPIKTDNFNNTSNSRYGRRISPHVEKGLHTSEMYFDVPQSGPLDQQTSAKVRALRWGSDISFVDQGYLAPPDTQNEEERTLDLFHQMECLEQQSSAANTRPSSPNRATHTSDWSMPRPADLRTSIKDNDSSRPRKKQKSKIKEEEQDDMDLDAPHRAAKKKRTSAKNRRLSSITESTPMGKPKLQSPTGGKPTRENLSEEQKRTNHILSEQKRRNLIKQGFDDLCALVPELHGGGFSKSAMLTQAADWLEDILRGNEILKAQLADLNARNGHGMHHQ
ncbi:hypothetical protein FQN54_004194 [Arachnomyces sp. PD_36]|nr:hypothetical protein FQN54_004194 [Arachnomyces sp. PD_36]